MMGTFQGPLPHHPQCHPRFSLGEAVTTLFGRAGIPAAAGIHRLSATTQAQIVGSARTKLQQEVSGGLQSTPQGQGTFLPF